MGLQVDIVGGLGGGAGHTGKDALTLTLYRLLQIAYDTSFKQIEESAERVIIFSYVEIQCFEDQCRTLNRRQK